MVKKLQQLNLSYVYPAVLADFNFNTCGDPDCGKFGVAPDFAIPVFKGREHGPVRHTSTVQSSIRLS